MRFGDARLPLGNMEFPPLSEGKKCGSILWLYEVVLLHKRCESLEHAEWERTGANKRNGRVNMDGVREINSD